MSTNQSKNGKLAEIFPTRLSAFLFILYMFLFVNQGILVHASQSNNRHYNYNVTSVVLCTEFLKLLICSVWYIKKTCSLASLWNDCIMNRSIAFRYLIPAFLYCLYNNLSFVNLANYDPTTYFILLQFRTVITGIIYQILFQKQLSCLQWFSLIILTIGCIVKNLGHTSSLDGGLSINGIMNIHLLLIFLQLFCSCFAGVYNEYLLKDNHKEAEVDILIQNIYMYFDSIICNTLFILYDSSNSFNISISNSLFDFSFLSSPIIWCILINGSLAGITTSFFLKSLNSILKTFAATIEIAISAIVCYLIFSTPIDRYTFLSITLIFIAVYIYSQKPITSTTASTKPILPILYKNIQCDDTQSLIDDSQSDD